MNVGADFLHFAAAAPLRQARSLLPFLNGAKPAPDAGWWMPATDFKATHWLLPRLILYGLRSAQRSPLSFAPWQADFWEGTISVKRWRVIASSALLFLGLALVSGVLAQQKQQPAVPDAPTPQPPPALQGVNGPITPGSGSGQAPSGPSSSSAAGQPQPEPSQPAPPPTPPPAVPQQQNEQVTPPAEGAAAAAQFVVQVNFVEVPVTVKDSKGNEVAGLTWRDFKVYENNTLEHLSVFSVDPRALSIAFVIDQTLPSNVMREVNQSMGSIQGALTPYDEAALFTYTNGAKEWTGFTGAQGNRLPAVLSIAQATGSDPQIPDNSGPLEGCNIRENGSCVSPVLQPGSNTGNDTFITIPKEIHTLNDAILQAAKELSTRPKDRLRMIYVVSDGKEYGSKATWKEVVHYLQTNKIAVYATLVGDSARWGDEWLDRFHLPFTMYDNILYKYTAATGGDMYAEGGVNGIEKSYQKVAVEARTQYTLGYLSHESIFDSKYRSIDVRVDRPNMVVIAKTGYYPSGQDYR
jgi:VWFA-related protein